MSNRRFVCAWPAALALIAVTASCAGPFGLPTGVKIKGSPEFDLPLGRYNFVLSDIFSTDDISGAMGGSDITIYEHISSPEHEVEAKTFLIHYSMPEVPINLDVSEFSTNFAPIDGPTLTIPDITNLSNTSITIPTGGGTVPQNADIPISGNPGVNINPDDPNDEFVEAEIEAGYLILRGNSGDNFSRVTITLTSEGKAPQVLGSPTQNSSDWRYDLAGKIIYAQTGIALGGTLRTGNIPRTTLTVAINATINRIKKATVRSSESSGETIPISFDDPALDWVEYINFTQTGLKVDLSPRIDGLTINVSALDFGINKSVPSDEATAASGMVFDGTVPGNGYRIEVGPESPLYDITVTINPDAAPAELTIYGDASNPLTPGGTVSVSATPSSLFEWNEAGVIPSRLPGLEALNGSFPNDEEGLDLSQITEALGSVGGADLQFDKIALNLYIDGAGTDEIINAIRLRLFAQWNNKTETEYLAGSDADFGDLADNAGKVPVFARDAEGKPLPFAGALPAPHLYKEITGIFNEKPEDLFFAYEISIGGTEAVTVKKEAGQSASIKPDLIIELPLAFKLGEEKDKDGNPLGYAALKISLADISSGGEDEEAGKDLFNRPDPEEEDEDDDDDEEFDYIDLIRSMGLDITYNNTLANASIFLTQEDEDPETGETVERFAEKLFSGDSEEAEKQTEFTLYSDYLKYPFMPVIEIRTEDIEGGYGKLAIKPDTKTADLDGDGKAVIKNAGIDFLKIIAKVETNIDLEL